MTDIIVSVLAGSMKVLILLGNAIMADESPRVEMASSLLRQRSRVMLSGKLIDCAGYFVCFLYPCFDLYRALCLEHPRRLTSRNSFTRVLLPFGFQLGLIKGSQQQGAQRWEEEDAGAFSHLSYLCLVTAFDSGCIIWLQLLYSNASSVTPNFFQVGETLFPILASFLDPGVTMISWY